MSWKTYLTHKITKALQAIRRALLALSTELEISRQTIKTDSKFITIKTTIALSEK